MLQILLATYNGEKFLKEQLDSLLNQTYDDFEIIARDDCSEDATFEILSEYKKNFPKKFTIYQNDKPTGSAKDNFFLLMNDADADYIMFCDQDDYWLPEKIELTLKKMKCIEEEGVPCLIHTDLSVTDKDLNITHKSYFKLQHLKPEDKINRALVQNCVTGCTVMINKPLLKLVKKSNDKNVIIHDWWIYLTACAFGKVTFVDVQTILYRQHDKNVVGAGNKIKNVDEMILSVDKTILNTSYFLKCYKNILSENHIILLSNYADIKKCNLLNRFLILRKYKLYKYPLIKSFLQIIITLFMN